MYLVSKTTNHYLKQKQKQKKRKNRFFWKFYTILSPWNCLWWNRTPRTTSLFRQQTRKPSRREATRAKKKRSKYTFHEHVSNGHSEGGGRVRERGIRCNRAARSGRRRSGQASRWEIYFQSGNAAIRGKARARVLSKAAPAVLDTCSRRERSDTRPRGPIFFRQYWPCLYSSRISRAKNSSGFHPSPGDGTM